MEVRDLYDENRNLTGQVILKGQKIPKGRYYITVVICIENSNNEFLFQKRSRRKNGKWALTGGHLKSGQTSKEGIIAEVKEELGLNITNMNFKLINTIKTEDDFIDIYYLKVDINIDNLILQKQEVEEVRWFTKEQIKELIRNKDFLKEHKIFLNTILIR